MVQSFKLSEQKEKAREEKKRPRIELKKLNAKRHKMFKKSKIYWTMLFLMILVTINLRNSLAKVQRKLRMKLKMTLPASSLTFQSRSIKIQAPTKKSNYLTSKATKKKMIKKTLKRRKKKIKKNQKNQLKLKKK